jgi:glycosyltransferase involved in cell wall biosynthesis
VSEEKNLRQLRILHIVGPDGVPPALQQSLFMPLLTRMPKARVKSQVVSLSPGAVPDAVLRQSGVPVHDVALSRKRFSFSGIAALVDATRQFRPDIIQAWGDSAQAITSGALRKRCDWKLKVVWSVANTQPLARDAGFIDNQVFKLAVRYAAKADRIVYTSEVAAAYHRRVGFPDGGHRVIAPGVDATRFKPDFATRRKIREQLKLPHDAFVIGMMAPFQQEYDHATFFKGIGELIKTNPEICVLLAGHGVQKGNTPLMAIVGGGQLAQRTQLLGEWSDVAAFYNACDIAVSTATVDTARMQLVIAMLCGVPCVATGMGAQGEVVGSFGVAIEPGSPAAVVRGINRVLLNAPEKRAFMAQGARKHALENFIFVRSMQKYLQLYYDLIGRQSLVTEDVPTPDIDATVNVPPPLPKLDAKPTKVADLSDPDSIEEKVQESTVTYTARPQSKPKPEPIAELPKASEGDVLETFSRNTSGGVESKSSAMTERARGGLADDEHEDLLSQDAIEAPAPAVLRAPSKARAGVNAGTAAALAGPPPGMIEPPKVAKPAAKVEVTPATAPAPAAAAMPEAKAAEHTRRASDAKQPEMKPPVPEVAPSAPVAPEAVKVLMPAPVPVPVPAPVPVLVPEIPAAGVTRSSRPAAVPVVLAAIESAPAAVAPIAAPGQMMFVNDAPAPKAPEVASQAVPEFVSALVPEVAPRAAPEIAPNVAPQVVPEVTAEAAALPSVVTPAPSVSVVPELSLVDTMSIFGPAPVPDAAEPIIPPEVAAELLGTSPNLPVVAMTTAESDVTPPPPEVPSPQLELLADPTSDEPKRVVGQSS